MWQWILTGLVVIGALVWTVARILSRHSRKSTGCDGGCDGCPLSGRNCGDPKSHI